MPTIRMKNAELAAEVCDYTPAFPKYTTQLMNLANQNAQGTRPSVVGQMTDLFPEFGGKTYEEWEAWYRERRPGALAEAARRVFAMIENLKGAITQIDEEMVRQWVDDLVLVKTFVGLSFQEAILSRVAAEKGTTYRVSTPEEESKGIDGYIGYIAVSIKPSTYEFMGRLVESLPVNIITYEKKKDGIVFSYDF